MTQDVRLAARLGAQRAQNADGHSTVTSSELRDLHVHYAVGAPTRFDPSSHLAHPCSAGCVRSDAADPAPRVEVTIKDGTHMDG
jgi:hypothetical protein